MTSSASCGSDSMPRTKPPSILSTSTANSRRVCSEDCPVPKSSIDSRTPSARRSLITRRAASTSVSMTVSVISSTRFDGERPCRRSIRATPSASPGFQNSRCETLTATLASRPPAFQAAIWAPTWSRTHEPSSTIPGPDSSTGRKVPGSSSPFSGCCQRTRAS